MSYQVVRVQGYSKGSLTGIGRENERDGSQYRNTDIDTELSHLNIALKETQNGFYAEYHDIRAALNVQSKEPKNAVAFEGLVITSDTAFFEGLGWERGKPTPPEVEKFFRESYEWAKGQIGYLGTDKNIMSAVVHMDETTPHLQLYYLPITEKYAKKIYAKDENGKILRNDKNQPIQLTKAQGGGYREIEDKEKPSHSKADFWRARGGNTSYRRMQDSYQEKVGSRYGLERGEIGSDREHQSHHAWKTKQLEKEIAPLQDLKEAADEVVPVRTKATKPLELVGLVTIKRKDYETLQSQAKSYAVNRDEVEHVRERMAAVAQREQAADQREIDLTKRSAEFESREESISEKGIKRRERMVEEERQKIRKAMTAELQPETHMYYRVDENDFSTQILAYRQRVAETGYLAEEMKRKAERKYQEQLSLNQRYEQLQKKLSDTNEVVASKDAEIKSLTQKISDLTDRFTKQIADTKAELWGIIIGVVQSIGLMKYTNNEYNQGNLTKPQGRVIDAVADYTAEVAEKDGLHEIAKDLLKKVGMNKGVEKHIDLIEEREKPQNTKNDRGGR